MDTNRNENQQRVITVKMQISLKRQPYEMVGKDWGEAVFPALLKPEAASSEGQWEHREGCPDKGQNTKRTKKDWKNLRLFSPLSTNIFMILSISSIISQILLPLSNMSKILRQLPEISFLSNDLVRLRKTKLRSCIELWK